MGFDLLLQSEEKLKLSSRIDDLPLKGGVELRAEYEFLQFELKKMAPPNGKAVLLFRAPCGCPVSKLEALGPKGSRRIIVYEIVVIINIGCGDVFFIRK
ncbi:hypothetical protein AMTR_s00025p00105600 [Amborella trichopoda]|uniref:Uncharacterized protein n=1 Tax=Amborella trichopoda TaxID=13333 RepID=W1PWU4_AMBTC|nr:hypothetical protein AMTR_s00025p00105600 [Amborella trichopoda]